MKITNIHFEHRSYRTKKMRPTPEIYNSTNLGIVLTPWGNSEITKKILPDITNYLQSAFSEVEATSPFEHLSCLSSTANHLRTALLIANESVYRTYNRDLIQGGFEALLISKNGPWISFARVGNPSLFYFQKSRGLVPLSVGREAFDVHPGISRNYEPLPSEMLGMEPNALIDCGDLQVKELDGLVCFSGPGSMHRALLNFKDISDLVSITKSLAQSHTTDFPFWIGKIP